MINFVMKGYELWWPDIEKEGLVLYHDFKGKSNAHTYRNVALNMSEAHEWAVIRNTSGTSQSGYTSRHAIVFDGVDDYLRTRIETGLTEMTMEMLLSLDKGKTYQTLIQCGASPYEWLLRYHNGRIDFMVNGTVVASAPVGEYFNGETHLAMVLTSSQIKIWLDGTLILTGAVSLTVVYPKQETLYIGMTYPNRHYLKGSIRSIRAYDRVLTEGTMTENRTLDKKRWNV